MFCLGRTHSVLIGDEPLALLGLSGGSDGIPLVPTALTR